MEINDLVKKNDVAEFRRVLAEEEVNVADSIWWIMHAFNGQHMEIARIILADGRFDDDIRNLNIIKFGKGEHAINTVRLLIDDERVKPSEAIKYYWEDEEVESLRFLLQHPRVDPSQEGRRTLWNALDGSQEETSILLISDKRVPLDSELLLMACEKGSAKVVKAFLDDPRIEMDVYLCRQMLLRVLKNEVAVVKTLLEDARIDPTCSRLIALEDAGRISIIKELLADERVQKSPHLQQAKNTCLWDAARNKRPAMVKYLIDEAGADPAYRGAFTAAVESGRLQKVEIFLEYETVDPSEWDNEAFIEAFMCLHSIPVIDRFAIAQLVLKHPKVDPSARDNKALWLAFCHREMDAAELLLSDPRFTEPANKKEFIKTLHCHGEVKEEHVYVKKFLCEN